jgi:hypothetical protein
MTPDELRQLLREGAEASRKAFLESEPALLDVLKSPEASRRTKRSAQRLLDRLRGLKAEGERGGGAKHPQPGK